MVKNSDVMKIERGAICEVHHVASGYHAVGMKRLAAPNTSKD